MNDERIAVIVLNYKSWKETLEEIDCCNRVLNADYCDIFVVDNASPNNSLEELEIASKLKHFNLLSSNENKGYAAGNNIGLRQALLRGYKYGLILNNDIIIDDPEMLEKMVSVLKIDNSVAVINPDIYAPDGHMFNRDSTRPSFWDLTFGMFRYPIKGRLIDDLGGYGYVYRPQGCCMMVDIEKLSEVDYMDENTFLYCEEPILAERLLKKGYRCACCNCTKVIHNHSTTVKNVFSKNRIIKMKNVSYKYYLKKYRRFNSMQIALCLFFNVIKMQLLS